jgi:histidyl-tRNA synthetase
MRVLDSKETQDQKICENAPKIWDSLSNAARGFFDKVQEALTLLEIPYEIDHTLVRGLDYYDHTTFEFKMKLPDEDTRLAVAGGGRYNGMVQQFGGPSIPAVGLAFGVDRLMLICQMAREKAEDKTIAVLNVESADQNEAFKIAQWLRKVKGIRVLFPPQDNVTKKLRFCDKAGVSCVIFVGESEIRKHELTIKFLRKLGTFEASEEIVIPTDSLMDFVNRTFLA